MKLAVTEESTAMYMQLPHLVCNVFPLSFQNLINLNIQKRIIPVSLYYNQVLARL